ncbi:hypothetical protein [Leucobacter luti]|uniref:hypothetical protein n=1 Tax=Leucobacter luti TaxID=340320 RepID=UPI003CFE9E64
MTQRTTTESARGDQSLNRRIAILMRIGTSVACVLLSIGSVVTLLRPGVVATTFLAGGCALLVLLPAIRLVMMAEHFVRQSQARYALIAVVVFALVVASGVVGLLDLPHVSVML